MRTEMNAHLSFTRGYQLPQLLYLRADLQPLVVLIGHERRERPIRARGSCILQVIIHTIAFFSSASLSALWISRSWELHWFPRFRWCVIQPPLLVS